LFIANPPASAVEYKDLERLRREEKKEGRGGEGVKSCRLKESARGEIPDAALAFMQ
jgi:hypothetical protein